MPVRHVRRTDTTPSETNCPESMPAAFLWFPIFFVGFPRFFVSFHRFSCVFICFHVFSCVRWILLWQVRRSFWTKHIFSRDFLILGSENRIRKRQISFKKSAVGLLLWVCVEKGVTASVLTRSVRSPDIRSIQHPLSPTKARPLSLRPSLVCMQLLLFDFLCDQTPLRPNTLCSI